MLFIFPCLGMPDKVSIYCSSLLIPEGDDGGAPSRTAWAPQEVEHSGQKHFVNAAGKRMLQSGPIDDTRQTMHFLYGVLLGREYAVNDFPMYLVGGRGCVWEVLFKKINSVPFVDRAHSKQVCWWSNKKIFRWWMHDVNCWNTWDHLRLLGKC